METAAVPLRNHDNKENIPPPSPACRIDPKLVHIRPCLGKKAAVVGEGMARKPLGDITHLFISSSVLTRSSSARGSGDRLMLHLHSPHPNKRRALDDVDLLRIGARSAKSLRMGFR